MKDEIKEILDNIKYLLDNERKFILITDKDTETLLDYITNLQKEVEDLREDNYAYHQLMKIQNKREYRSKFLKEFQEEFGTNTFPDYDEIYKRYDKVKKENKELNRMCEMYSKSLYNADLTKAEKRIDKAIEYINNHCLCEYKPDNLDYDNYENIDDKLLNILNGDDE